MHNSFSIELSKVIVKNLFNNYNNNIDTFRFGPQIEKQENPVKLWIRKELNKRGYYSIPTIIDFAEKSLEGYTDKINYFEYLYGLLEDDYSRDLLIKVCAYRILGDKKIKLPMNNPEFWNKVSYIKNNLAVKNNYLQGGSSGEWKMPLYSLNPIGYPIQLYFTETGIYYDFIYKCYFYNKSVPEITVNEGDYVIDAGGCYGDTALFFAHHAGNRGKVYSFEFVPENIEILSKNIEINLQLKERIELMQIPLWSEPGIPVYYEQFGPATKVSMSPISEKSSIVKTTTIDQLVSKNQIKKVDFIKMDIEGAEIEALKGGEKTIRKYKPKLAISLYHSEQDFKRIPEFIKNLDMGYRFYFNHYTMFSAESVLFCN
ncbi:MAG: FkbM family methyltransferase [Bacteroidia bacterium]